MIEDPDVTNNNNSKNNVANNVGNKQTWVNKDIIKEHSQSTWGMHNNN